MAVEFDSNFSFNQQLWFYYTTNRGKIRSRYNDLTRKFLAYNDSDENPHAFLRKPQFEALEMYVFVKEFMNNKQVYEMFDDWRHKRERFSDASYYAIDKGGQLRIGSDLTEKQTDTLFKQMKKYREDYPNYIYALTMGLGKTILMATCIFYEFLLVKKYPRDKRFCHNALVSNLQNLIILHTEMSNSIVEIISSCKHIVLNSGQSLLGHIRSRKLTGRLAFPILISLM